jgi:PTH1 family peptidyl-tRNA hydrolase
VVIIGLGNPGRRYERTRHNVGFELVDILAGRWGARRGSPTPLYSADCALVGGREVYLLKPMKYMNRSGIAVRRFLEEKGWGPGQCLVVVDDMALEVGRLRFRRRGTSGGHNGLASIEESLGTDEYPRLRIGVGPAPESAEWVDFVLTDFLERERPTLDETLARAADGVESLLRDGIDKTMSLYNN